jgi:hypothetical protein
MERAQKMSNLFWLRVRRHWKGNLRREPASLVVVTRSRTTTQCQIKQASMGSGDSYAAFISSNPLTHSMILSKPAQLVVKQPEKDFSAL